MFCLNSIPHNLKFKQPKGKEKSFENLVGKGENAGNQHFLPFLQGFLHIHRPLPSLHLSWICHIHVCECFQFGQV